MYDTIIVGGGLAGATAAIYASRKEMDFVLLSKNFGGQLNMVDGVENFPFFKETNWKELKSRLKEQIEYLGVDFRKEKAVDVEKLDKGFEVSTDENSYKSRTVLITTGAEPKRLNVPGAARLSNSGVEYSVVSDAPKFKGEKVAVIGGGDSAAEAADHLSEIASKIYVLTHSEEMECQEELKENLQGEKTEIIKNAETTEILGEETVEGLKYMKGGEEKRLEVSGVFPAIGMRPQTEFVENLLDIDEDGHIKVDIHCRTSVPGIFAAGDCTNIHQYQLTIAAGHGTIALLKAAEYIRKKNK